METRAKRAIKQLAQEKGVPEEQIIQEMEAAIAEGLRVSTQSGNRAALEIWNRIPRKGEVPTAEEFIEFFCGALGTFALGKL